MTRIVASVVFVWALAACVGCGQKPLHFPATSRPDAAKAAGASAAFDTNGNDQADFFTFAGPTGRVERLGYDTSDSGKADVVLDLSALDKRNCRHLVIILDGFAYSVVKDFYDAGGLRMCHAPSKVIAPYPTLTDLCMEDALGYIPCPGFEAAYFDRHRNKVVGGSLAYMAGSNEPYNALLDYRASLIWDAISYLKPWQVFGKELNDCARLYQRNDRRDLLAYFVSSAGIGTREGAAGQRRALAQVDRLVNQVIWESRGMTAVTLLSDHGHSYRPATRIPLDSYLKQRGWRVTDKLSDPRDVVYIRFGLETYASFATQRSAGLAVDLAACEGVTIASYAQDDAVVALGRDGGRATVRRKGDRYKYEVQKGDPLQLKDALTQITADADGYFAADDLLKATVDGAYPDPLARLWRAHFNLAQNTPDVIVSLEDNFYSGSTSFGSAVTIASTHGSINRTNSTAFIMSTLGPLPPFMRSSDIPAHMSKLTGRPWAQRR
ncbi:MAG: hypothetical protein WC869_04570 [Phycisphaerae bacterium]|jgi:predicted small lipoprotein YifL